MKSEKALKVVKETAFRNKFYCNVFAGQNGNDVMTVYDAKTAIELAEQEAEERMREELTRWHDPEEKLPEDDKDVLCMADRQSNTYEVMRHDKHGWWVHVPIPEGGWCACDCNVIRWREIHENK